MNRNSKRTGATLVIALVFSAVATMFLITSLSQTLRTYRSTRLDLQRPQVQLMIDAGMRKALSELRTNASYTGETWDVSPAFENQGTSLKQITITRNDDGDSVEITITAHISDLSPSDKTGIRQSYTFTLPLSTLTSQTPENES